ncbi:hypothetical protein [Nocardia sp. NPDC058666]|uniref:hypothetical protein n=1 Tax=Nocardia sp. NPDC058666 TaxID=3346587 RepID=UPI003658071A
MRDGSIPEAIVLSHEDDRERLALTVPEALPNVVVAGDPCFDRMRASRHLIHAYRTALGATADTTVVTVSSTWGPGSVLGRHPDLINDLLAELPLDDHIVAAIVHPNAWFAHGPLQLRTWFADALRAGLRLIPPVTGWQHTVLASDIVIGDHGSVTGYAAAQGIPTALAAFPRDEVADGCTIDLLGNLAPTLHPLRPLPEQIARTITEYDPGTMGDLRASATSHPGACLDTLRATFYRLLQLPEPDRIAPEFPYPASDLVPYQEHVGACWISCEWNPDGLGGNIARIRRWPADVTARRRRGHRTTDATLVVHEDHPRRDLSANADVVVVSKTDADSDELLCRTLEQRPGCSMAVIEVGPGRVRLRYRNGTTLEAFSQGSLTGPLPVAYIAAVAHIDPDTAAGEEPEAYTLMVGEHRITFSLTNIDSSPE